MSDGEAAAGQKESQFIRPKLKATKVKVFACILALFGALVISIQVGDPSSVNPARLFNLFCVIIFTRFMSTSHSNMSDNRIVSFPTCFSSPMRRPWPAGCWLSYPAF